MDATARPRRTTTNVSPWRSTASKSSENRRAASVALIRRTVNQIIIFLARGTGRRAGAEELDTPPCSVDED